MRKKRKDPNQLSFDFDAKIEKYVALKEEFLAPPRASPSARSFEEDCISLAVGLKNAIVESGLSREQIADAINVTYGWPLSEAYNKLSSSKRKTTQHLSVHMLNHYLSKPVEYKIPGYLIFGIQRVTQSLKATDALAADISAQVISKEEKRHLTLGKLDTTILEMQRLKKELRCRQ